MNNLTFFLVLTFSTIYFYYKGFNFSFQLNRFTYDDFLNSLMNMVSLPEDNEKKEDNDESYLDGKKANNSPINIETLIKENNKELNNNLILLEYLMSLEFEFYNFKANTDSMFKSLEEYNQLKTNVQKKIVRITNDLAILNSQKSGLNII